MTYLTDGILKDVYDKCRDYFVNSIDRNIHIKAYEHKDSEPDSGFAETEFAGKYLDTCMHFYEFDKDEKVLENAKAVVKSIIANQREDGYVGGYRRGAEFEAYSVWNQAFTVYGLVAYYLLTGDEGALNAAENSVKYIADYYMNNSESDILKAIWGTQNLAILDTLPRLYNITGDKLYMDFMEHTFDRLKNSNNNFFDFHSILDLGSQKGIENFCVLISMVMYYEITGDKTAFDAANKYWEELNETQIRQTGNGTIGELWTENGNEPKFLDIGMRPNENCVAVGWCELSMILFRNTHESKYIDAVEKTLYNHILSAVDNYGKDFAYYQPNFGVKITKTNENEYKCCRYRGYSAVSQFNDILFFETDESIIPGVYANSVFESEDVKIEEKTNYPFDDTVEFMISGNTDKSMKIRIPHWCEKYTVTKNGEVLDAKKQSGYINIDSLYDGDVITVCFNTQVKSKKAVIDGKNYVSFTYGDILLVPDSSICDDIYGKKDVTGEFARNTDTEFNIEFTSGNLRLVDYASAGKKHDGDEYTEWILTE